MDWSFDITVPRETKSWSLFESESFWYHDVESAFVLQVVGDFGQIRRFSNAVDPEKHDRIPALRVASFSPLGRANVKNSRRIVNRS